MKIVDYDTFVRMPAGTIFAPYEPCIYSDRFQIKVDEGHEYPSMLDGKPTYMFNGTMPLEPWFSTEPYDWPDKVGTYPTEMCVYDGDSNDAAEYKMFAIMEPHEVKKLIEALHWALNGCHGEFDEHKEDV